MAKIQTKTIVVKFNKIVKNGDTAAFYVSPDIAKTLEEVAQEMCDSSIIVEVEEIDE
jgi:hypothetical protein